MPTPKSFEDLLAFIPKPRSCDDRLPFDMPTPESFEDLLPLSVPTMESFDDLLETMPIPASFDDLLAIWPRPKSSDGLLALPTRALPTYKMYFFSNPNMCFLSNCTAMASFATLESYIYIY